MSDSALGLLALSVIGAMYVGSFVLTRRSRLRRKRFWGSDGTGNNYDTGNSGDTGGGHGGHGGHSGCGGGSSCGGSSCGGGGD